MPWSYVVVSGLRSERDHQARVDEIEYAIEVSNGLAERCHSPQPWSFDSVSTFQVAFNLVHDQEVFHLMASPVDAWG